MVHVNPILVAIEREPIKMRMAAGGAIAVPAKDDRQGWLAIEPSDF
jgi:hypothetical protein